MWFDLASAEAQATDQASLKAARGLAKTSQWPELGCDDFVVWGYCQGSGANPYKAVVDSRDLGYRCSCPSRKFPCKHSLALMLIVATQPEAMTPQAAPEWVTQWLSRRRGRKNTGGSSPVSVPSGSPSGGDSLSPVPPATQSQSGPASAEAAAKKAARAEARLVATQETVSAGLEELEDWIADQLRLGLGRLIAEAGDQCRRIAARLVDHKAPAIASRLDEMPARLASLPPQERPHQAVRELGKLVALIRAYRCEPEAPHVKRAIIQAETRADLLDSPEALKVASIWEVAGSRVATRRDGLTSQVTWLVNLGEGPPFGLLQDYFPASVSTRVSPMPSGLQIAAELVYYPGGEPMRAVIAVQEPVPVRLPWPGAAEPGRGKSVGREHEDSYAPPRGDDRLVDPLIGCYHRWNLAPWELETPVMLEPGVVLADKSGGQYWWAEGQVALPLAQAISPALVGSTLEGFAVWDGARLDLVSLQSQFGPVWL
jgi:hypothetical protein